VELTEILMSSVPMAVDLTSFDQQTSGTRVFCDRRCGGDKQRRPRQSEQVAKQVASAQITSAQLLPRIAGVITQRNPRCSIAESGVDAMRALGR
jgi:hypothetical protein